MSCCPLRVQGRCYALLPRRLRHRKDHTSVHTSVSVESSTLPRLPALATRGLQIIRAAETVWKSLAAISIVFLQQTKKTIGRSCKQVNVIKKRASNVESQSVGSRTLTTPLPSAAVTYGSQRSPPSKYPADVSQTLTFYFVELLSLLEIICILGALKCI